MRHSITSSTRLPRNWWTPLANSKPEGLPAPHLKPISGSAPRYAISKNSTKNLKLKIQLSGKNVRTQGKKVTLNIIIKKSASLCGWEQIEPIWLLNPLKPMSFPTPQLSPSYHSRWYDHSQLYFKSPKYIFNESKRKSWLWYMHYDLRYCWNLSLCFTRWNSVISLEWHGSIHPAAIYHKDASNVIQEKSFDFISEDLKHDTAFVCEVMSKVCEYVKGNYQRITKLKYFLMAVQPNIKITKIS